MAKNKHDAQSSTATVGGKEKVAPASRHEQPYGDLVALNTCRTIADAIGTDLLRQIVDDFLELPGTSAAVYEKNGDYALGIFASGWCRFMDQSSRNLCGTDDNKEALSCGKWHCHESCWKVSKTSMDTVKPADHECLGGINIYAVPIEAGGKVVGSINFGYGGPPTDRRNLEELAQRYGVSVEDLTREARSYNSCSPEAIDITRSRLRTAAKLIGTIIERKQAERALRESERRLRSALDGLFKAPVGLCFLDRELRYVFINEWLAEINGISVEGHLGRTIGEVLPEVAAAAELQLRHVLETGEPVIEGIVEAETPADPGRKRVFQHNYYPVVADDGTVVGVSCAVQDITRRKQAEEGLKESEQHFRLYSQSTGDCFWNWDMVGGTVERSSGFDRSFGYREQEIRSDIEWWGERIHPEDKERVWKVFDAAVAGDQSICGYEYRFRCQDGSYAVVDDHVCLIRDATGKVVRSLGAMRDITERKRAEVALRESELRFRQLAETIGAVFWLTDWATRKVLYVSPAYETIWGRSCQSLYDDARSWALDIHPDDRARVVRLFEREVENGDFDVEYRIIRPDGSTRWIHDQAFPIRDAAGRVHRVSGISVDVTARKRAEQALRDSEERLRLTLDAVSDGGWDWNVETGEVFYSDRWIESLGYERDEVEPDIRFWETILHPDDKERTTDVLKAHFEGRSDSYECENRLRMKGGEYRWNLDRGRVVARDAEGKPVRMVGTDTDISTRKQTEQSLRMTQFAIDNSADPVYCIRADGRIVYANEAASRSLGHSQDELARMSVTQIDPDFPREVWQAHWKKMKQAGSLTFEGHHRTKQGHVFPVEITTNYLEFEGGEHLWAFVRDISERRRAESEQKLSATIADNMAEGILLVRVLDNTIVFTNRRFDAIFGYGDGELIGQHVTALNATGSKTPEQTADEIIAGVEKNGLWHGEVHNVKKDGTTFWCRVTVSVFDHPEFGQVWLTVQGDITERKQAEQERERLIVDLEARNAEMERFTYTVSHDLKSPLITIRGFLGLLKNDAIRSDVKSMENDMAQIDAAASTMQRLLDDLLELSRVGRVVNPPQQMDLREVATEAAELVGGQVALHHVRLEIADNLPVVCGDRPRIVEVLQNLIDNAAKFMGDQPDPHIEIGVRTDHRDPMCFVRDNGIGIEPRFHEKVFGLFNRLDSKVEGTGVGLALAKRIIEVHGGQIWIESKGKGHGSTFWFTLPSKGDTTDHEQRKPARGTVGHPAR